MSIKSYIVLPLGILVTLVFNSTVLASSCKTKTGTICLVNCAVGTAYLSCGNNQCTGGCVDISKSRKSEVVSALVTDIYRNNNGNIPITEIIKFLQKSKGKTISEEDKERYGEIIFPFEGEVSAISNADWKKIEKNFSGLTKNQLMDNKQSITPTDNKQPTE